MRELLDRAFMMVGHALPAELQHQIIAELAKPDTNAGLKTIADTIQSWLDYHESIYAKEGKEVDLFDHVITLPFYPDRYTLEKWVKLLNSVGEQK